MLRDQLFFGRATTSFTLQWHLTNACELDCRHCYDRSARSVLRLDEGREVLSQLARFCASRRVSGHVSFTGGNPWLHPDFLELYQAAARAGFGLSVLGNPVDDARLLSLLAIRRPRYYQVSLEGLPDHDDAIRGAGHFERTLAFLDRLNHHRVPSHVMLTLTRANADQLLPLAQKLEGRAHRFSWSRLAAVGSGQALEQVGYEELDRLLRQWELAARTRPFLGKKEGLLNRVRDEARLPRWGGCTGHGCGAAFNFLALLPDGEVHACRKLPSRLGTLRSGGVVGAPEGSTIQSLYEGQAARKYRGGSRACRGCHLRRQCGGCLAVTAGNGLDPLTALDPHCLSD